MANGVIISECKAGEIDDSIKELWLNLATEMFKVEDLILPSISNAEKWFTSACEDLASNKGILFVAKNGKKTVGFIKATMIWNFPLEVKCPIAQLDDLYVLPEFRRRGIGERLLISCLDRIKKAGIRVVRIRVLSQNESAKKLYDKLSFKIYNYGMMKLIDSN